VALAGSDKAYTQARSGIARSGATRSGAVWPLLGTIIVGDLDLTAHIQTQTLRITQALNEQPDTASFDVVLTDGGVQAVTTVGNDVLITLAGDPLFGGRVLTAQTTKRHGAVPSLRSVFCADYLQVLDSEYLITYEWPPQSATLTILDLIARFANKPHGVPISTAAVAPGLPSLARLGVINERFSTLLRRIVTSFDGGSKCSTSGKGRSNRARKPRPPSRSPMAISRRLPRRRTGASSAMRSSSKGSARPPRLAPQG